MPDQVAITLPVEDGLPAADHAALAELAERCGYDAVLAGEIAGPEVFSLLGMIAARTTSIRIGSGIVGCYPRPPALHASWEMPSSDPGARVAGAGADAHHVSRAQTVRPPVPAGWVPHASGPVRAAMMSSPWGRSPGLRPPWAAEVFDFDPGGSRGWLAADY